MTKSELAAEIGLSTSVLRAYERGSKNPLPVTLARISEVLEYPTAFFKGPDLEEPPVDGTSFRAMSRLSAKDRDRALAAGTLALALSDWIEARFRLPEPAVPRFEGLSPELAAMGVRNEWKLASGPSRT